MLPSPIGRLQLLVVVRSDTRDVLAIAIHQSRLGDPFGLQTLGELLRVGVQEIAYLVTIDGLQTDGCFGTDGWRVDDRVVWLELLFLGGWNGLVDSRRYRFGLQIQCVQSLIGRIARVDLKRNCIGSSGSAGEGIDSIGTGAAAGDAGMGIGVGLGIGCEVASTI